MFTDKYGRKWPCPEMELCLECGQPDNTGDCDHEKLSVKEVLWMGGEVTAKEKKNLPEIVFITETVARF